MDFLDLPVVQTRLHLPADQQFTLPESPLVRTLYDCPDVTVGAERTTLSPRGSDSSERLEKTDGSALNAMGLSTNCS